MRVAMPTIVSVTDADLETFCQPAGLSELTPALVRRQGPDACLMVMDVGRPAARASLWWRNTPPHAGHRLGLIGHYAARDAGVASLLLEKACAILASQACTLGVGPMDGSTWRRYRLLTHRGAELPFFLEPDNPDDWPNHFEQAGFTSLARYFSSVNLDIDRGRPSVEPVPPGVRLREFDPRCIESEMSCLWQVAAAGFAGNFLYSPIEEAEFREIYGPLMPLVRPELVQFVEVHGEPAGFCFAVPDLLQARRGYAVDTVVLKSLAVLPDHRRRRLGRVLVASVVNRARTLGFRRAIFALMHEDNPSRRLERAVMRDFRQYTLFGRAL